MRLTVQFALSVLLGHAAGFAAAQNSGAASAAATRAAAPAAVTTPVPTQQAPSNGAGQHGGARSAATRRSDANAGANRNGAASVRGATVTGVPQYQAGFRGPSDTKAPIATGEVSVIGGKGDAATVNPTTSSLFLPSLKNALGVPSGTMISVRLLKEVDSGHAHNGDLVEGVLTAPLGSAPAGSRVTLTVVATAAAGQMTSAGELSLQVVSVNGENILSNVITAEGQEGKVLLPGDAPPRGTEASFSPATPMEIPAA